MKRIKTYLSLLLCAFMLVFCGCDSAPAETTAGEQTVTDGKTEKDETTDAETEEPLTGIDKILDQKIMLKFNTEGNFKIAVFSDLDAGASPDTALTDNIAKILDSEQPDLVILGGDFHDATVADESALRGCLNAITEPMNSRSIPWCTVFGALAESGNTGFDRETQLKICRSYEYCVTGDDDKDVYGVGNYLLPVMSSDGKTVAFTVFCLDSNSNLNDYVDGLENQVLLPNTLSGGTKLDSLHFTQLLWYWNTSVFLEEYYGNKIPGIMYFQIPPYQFSYIYRNSILTEMDGVRKQMVTSSEIDSGIVWCASERGDIKGIFCGYDRTNDYCGKYLDMYLGCTSSIGKNADSETSGARIIECSADGTVQTRMIYINK